MEVDKDALFYFILFIFDLGGGGENFILNEPTFMPSQVVGHCCGE